MRVTYERQTDAAYIYLADQIPRSQVHLTYACDPGEVKGQIHLDFDSHGVLLGIEVLDASRLLPKELLKSAK